MPASAIMKEVTLPDNWVQLQKMLTPDQDTGCYWSVWYDVEINWNDKGTAWLMWCPFGDDPSVNDSWGHVEDLEEPCRNIVDTIESVYGVSFHESIWVKMDAVEVFPARSIPSGPVAIGKGETWDGE